MAEARILESKEVFRELLPENSLLEGQSWFHLARLKQRGHEWRDADEPIKRAKGIYTKVLGADHRDFAVILRVEAEIATPLHELSHAADCWHDCLIIRQKSMLPTDPRLRDTVEAWMLATINLAWHEIHEADNDQSSGLIRSPIRDSQKLLKPDDPLIRFANSHLEEFILVAAMPKEERERFGGIRARTLRTFEPGKIESAEEQRRRIDELEADRLAIEDHAIVVTSSAREIPGFLSQPKSQAAWGRSLIVGGIEFDTEVAGKSDELRIDASKSLMWQPLSGTEREVNSIAVQLRTSLGEDHVTLLTGKTATAAEIRRQMQTSELIHLATHGFYDPPELQTLFASQSVRSSSDAGGLRFALSPTEVEPELLSGIVFAGANNLARCMRVDAVISARELASLDLTKVRLACLSACETGIGEQHSSESSLGLCRSFHAAGAQACLVSLWRVDDQATASLMSEFYRSLLTQDLTKAESLRQAQISLIRDSTGSSQVLRRGATLGSGSTELIVGAPYFWAGFVLSGDWR